MGIGWLPYSHITQFFFWYNACMKRMRKPAVKLEPIRFTKAGFEKLQQEQEDLIKQRPAVLEDLKKARELGDLKENGYYKASRAKLNFIDGRLFRIKVAIKQAVIVDEATTEGIGIGKNVTLESNGTKITYTLVGDMEANPTEGKISLLSPLGKALENKRIGDEAIIETPMKKIVYKIVAIN